MVVHASGVSETGRFRKTNEDRFVSDPAIRLYAVADGLGGHSAGEVASRLAVESVATFISRSKHDTDSTWPYGIDDTLSLEGNRLRTAIQIANRCILDAADTSDDYRGMGTTFVGLLLNGSRLSIGHVGDSRLYLLSGGVLHQLTQDDSLAAMMSAQDSSLAANDAALRSMRNVLTNVLGAQDQVDVHVSERTIEDGDVLLLCTDGLHGVLDSELLREILGRRIDVGATARLLVDTALDQGSRDNVTALVVVCDADS